MPGSVSKYCLQHSPVPVIVVRPSSKRDKKKRKRLRDPTRRGYRDILDKSEDVAEGGHMLDERNFNNVMGGEGLGDLGVHDAEEEARKVAEAIGYAPGRNASASEGAPLSRVISGRSDVSGRSARSGSLGSLASDSPEDVRSPIGSILKSPELRDLDSPPGSDDSSDEDGEMEAVPAYVIAQEEALMKARERAMKTEEEERERELERSSKENTKPKRGGKKSEDYEGAGGALSLLDELDSEIRKHR